MNPVSPFTSQLLDASPAADEKLLAPGVSPVNLDDFIHELRQPLGVIESLTYFIEISTTDESIAPRLQHIQSMLAKAHHILQDASARGVSQLPAVMPGPRR